MGWQTIDTRRKIAKRYDLELKNLPLKTPYQLPETYSSYHLYPICISENEASKTQRQADGLYSSRPILVWDTAAGI